MKIKNKFKILDFKDGMENKKVWCFIFKFVIWWREREKYR